MLKVYEVNLFIDGDETGTLFTETFQTFKEKEAFLKDHGRSIEVFSQEEVYIRGQ